MRDAEAWRTVRRLSQPQPEEHRSTRHPTAAPPTPTASSPEAKQPAIRNSYVSASAAELPRAGGAVAAELQRGDRLARLQQPAVPVGDASLQKTRHRLHRNFEHSQEAPRRSARNGQTELVSVQHRDVVAS